MPNLTIIITAVITNLIMNIILYDYFDTKYQNKYGNNGKIAYILVATIVMVFANVFNNPSINLLLTIILFIILNYVLFKSQNKKALFINIAFFVVLLSIESIIYILVEYVTINLDLLSKDLYFIEIKMILCSLVQFIIYNVLKKYFVRSNVVQLKKIDIASYLVISGSSLFIGAILVLLINRVDENVQLFFFMLAVGLTIFNIYYMNTITLISQRYEMQLKLDFYDTNSKRVMKQYQQMVEKGKATYSVLHDIKNHLQTLENSIKNKNMDEEIYLKTIKDKIDCLSPITITNRKILNVLFMDKIDEAKMEGIKINFNVDKELSLSFIDDYDIISIFSNILDNAIYATKDLNEPDKLISLHIQKIKEFIIISEINPCQNDIEKKGNDIVSNKQGHSGLGIKNIQKILDKFDAQMVIEVDNLTNEFSNTIVFFS